MSAFFDFIMFVISVAFVVMGAKRGAIREVFRFAAMVGGFIFAFLFFRDLQASMKGFMENQQVVAATAFIFIFIAVFLAIMGVGLLLHKFTKLIMLGWCDSILGAALGLFKAMLIAWVACLSISSMPFQKVQNEFGSSVVYKMFRAMPRGLTLSGLEDTKTSIRGNKKKHGGEDDDESAPPPNKRQQKKSGKAAGTDV